TAQSFFERSTGSDWKSRSSGNRSVALKTLLHLSASLKTNCTGIRTFRVVYGSSTSVTFKPFVLASFPQQNQQARERRRQTLRKPNSRWKRIWKSSSTRTGASSTSTEED